MIKRHPLALTIIVIALLAFIGTMAAIHAPVGMPIVVYWSEGVPIHVTPAPEAFFIPVALAAGLALVFALFGRIFRRCEHAAATGPGLLPFMLALMAAYELMVVAPVFGVILPSWLSPTIAICGLFYIATGNAMPKQRPALIRRPETPRDINHLVATRRFGSRFWIIAGVALVVAALLPVEPAARHIVYKVAIWVAILPPLLYSWFWRERPAD
jgi:ABC-type polysaccharide/polyol phosphate export permease